MVEMVESAADLRRQVSDARAKGKKIGLVPTMGALHDGHLRLIRQCRAETDFVVVSIFVNPTQFGAGEDLNRYPRPLEDDLTAERVRRSRPGLCSERPNGVPARDEFDFRRGAPVFPTYSKAPAAQDTFAASPRSCSSCLKWSVPTWPSSVKKTTSSSSWSDAWSPTFTYPCN